MPHHWPKFAPEYWPAVVIGLLAGAYWARVIHLVRKTRRITGNSANLLPPERLGRALRIVWYPAVVAWVIVPFIVAYHPHRTVGLRLIWVQPIVAWSAVVIALAAFLATLVCWKKMGKSWRMGINPNEVTQLIITGPYAYVRHPIYALQCLLLLMSFLAVPTDVMAIIALLGIALLQWEARREERYLMLKHGTEYESYLRHVGRFIPKSMRGYRS